ncbi:MAG: DUF4260 domain-containing protein, partial [Chloroflexota bacterium]
MVSQTIDTPSERTTLSAPRIMLHIEGLVIFVMSIVAYWQLGGNGWLFVALFLVPDLVFIIYIMHKPTGITLYNLTHTLSLPIILGALAYFAGWQFGILLCLIWLAHIGMDRTIGYGLKYQTGFKDTHLN